MKEGNFDGELGIGKVWQFAYVKLRKVIVLYKWCKNEKIATCTTH